MDIITELDAYDKMIQECTLLPLNQRGKEILKSYSDWLESGRCLTDKQKGLLEAIRYDKFYYLDPEKKYNGYVYFIVYTNSITEKEGRQFANVKIGYSINPTKRLEQIKTAVPDAVIYKTIKNSDIKNHRQLEQFYHRKFKYFNVGREVFNLPLEYLDDIVDIYKQEFMGLSSIEKSLLGIIKKVDHKNSPIDPEIRLFIQCCEILKYKYVPEDFYIIVLNYKKNSNNIYIIKLLTLVIVETMMHSEHDTNGEHSSMVKALLTLCRNKNIGIIDIIDSVKTWETSIVEYFQYRAGDILLVLGEKPLIKKSLFIYNDDIDETERPYLNAFLEGFLYAMKQYTDFSKEIGECLNEKVY